jgi:3-oxoacyl-[acyl-carrier-protein] synthase-1
MELGLPSEFLAMALGAEGPAFTISTACSSAAKALASAKRYLEVGLCDAVIAGGADMLCGFTVAGFLSLEALSPELCIPFSAKRRGINIGEAAALFLVTRGQGPVRLLGAGESSDAYNVSAPEPGGRGAAEAMQLALKHSGLKTSDIDYINLHGTGTPHNDSMESRAVEKVFGLGTPCSSTKPLTGHTLGTAGALEAAFCWLLLSGENPQGALAPHIYDGAYDPALPAIRLVKPGETLGRPLQYLASNSFGFGGSNASLILGRG